MRLGRLRFYPRRYTSWSPFSDVPLQTHQPQTDYTARRRPQDTQQLESRVIRVSSMQSSSHRRSTIRVACTLKVTGFERCACSHEVKNSVLVGRVYRIFDLARVCNYQCNLDNACIFTQVVGPCACNLVASHPRLIET